MASYRLIASPGCGSAMIEMALLLAQAPHEVEEIPFLQPGPARERLLALNPTGQVPTLLLPDGSVMTESAAIVLHLAERFPASGLAPPTESPERALFLRWLVFIVAQIYPTFTFTEAPSRWGVPAQLESAYQAAIVDYRLDLWRLVETAAGAPWFLGTRFSALDLFPTVMSHWSPGKALFDGRFPKLAAIGRQAEALPAVAQVMERNFRGLA